MSNKSLKTSTLQVQIKTGSCGSATVKISSDLEANKKQNMTNIEFAIKSRWAKQGMTPAFQKPIWHRKVFLTRTEYWVSRFEFRMAQASWALKKFLREGFYGE